MFRGIVEYATYGNGRKQIQCGSPARQIEPEPKYRPDVDGMRALAVLAVIGIHIEPKIIVGGRAGVDIFFVISGFLITGIILRALSANKFSYQDFYARRVRRIFPSMIIVLLVVSLLGSLVLLPIEYQTLGRDILTGATFTLNIDKALQPDFAPSDTVDFGSYFLPHLWSLGVEEQFYLFWPVWLVATWKLSNGRLAIVAMVVATITVLSLTLFVISSPSPNRSSGLPWNRLWELCAGGLLSCAQIAGADPIARIHLKLCARLPVLSRFSLHNAIGIAGTLLLVASIVNDPLHGSFAGAWALTPALGTVMLIAAGPQSWINRRVLSARTLVFTGLISYPLYLWHWPLLALLWTIRRTPYGSDADSGTVLVVAASFILSFLTYRYVELPIRSAPRARTGPALCGAMLVCACIGTLAFTDALQRFPKF